MTAIPNQHNLSLLLNFFFASTSIFLPIFHLHPLSLSYSLSSLAFLSLLHLLFYP
ncbi:hypothetical protein BJX96DRAFT_151811 [Aspergillus floccosus]